MMTNLYHLIATNLILAYLGPETVMPLASILATIIGALLIGWRFIVGFFKKIFKRSRREEEEAPQDIPAEGVVISQVSEKDDH